MESRNRKIGRGESAAEMEKWTFGEL